MRGRGEPPGVRRISGRGSGRLRYRGSEEAKKGRIGGPGIRIKCSYRQFIR